MTRCWLAGLLIGEGGGAQSLSHHPHADRSRGEVHKTFSGASLKCKETIGGKKNNKLAHYIWSGGIQVHGSPEILKKRNFLHSRRTVELVQPRDRVLLCGWTVPLKLTLADDGTLSGRVFYFFILYNRFKTASSILPNKETKNTARSFFFQRKPSRVGLRRIYFNFLFFFPPPEKSRLIRSQWGTQACPPTCRLYCVMVRECCVISLFQFTQVAQKKISISSSKKKKKKKISTKHHKNRILTWNETTQCCRD